MGAPTCSGVTTTLSRACPRGAGTTMPRCTRGMDSAVVERAAVGAPGQGGSGVLAHADSSKATRASEPHHGRGCAIRGAGCAALAGVETDRVWRWVMVCFAWDTVGLGAMLTAPAVIGVSADTARSLPRPD